MSLHHGGRLRQVAAETGRPLAQWLDLSTGINPKSWQPDQPIPISCWQRLPEEDDGLGAAARDYYSATSVLPVAGSQAAIQALPRLRRQQAGVARVAMAQVAYAEHAWHWQQQGHQVELLAETSFEAQVEQLLPGLDLLLLINPTNPSGRTFSVEQLLQWHQQLAARGGWLVVDEAFIDPTPDQSLAVFCDREGLIVLRSVGKFFGLAGARVGFVLAVPSLLNGLAELLGPWAVSGPSRWLVTQALADTDWHQQTIRQLHHQSDRLHGVLTAAGLKPAAGTALFQYCPTPRAAEIYQQLRDAGVLVRYFEQPSALRFGLPAEDNNSWQQLIDALEVINEKAK